MTGSVVAGIGHLLRAYDYALEADSDIWDFAVEIDVLRAIGMTASDLRWLVAKELVAHGDEVSVYGERRRTFQPAQGFTFLTSTAFVLTPAGAALARGLANVAKGGQSSENGASSLYVPNSASQLPKPHVIGAAETLSASPARGKIISIHGKELPEGIKPVWDGRTRALRIGEVMIKQFRVPAKNQERILAAFEEEAWPDVIDDPLPMKAEIVPKRRLNNVIVRLNGGQIVPLLRFHGIGNGEAIGWHLRTSPLTHDASGVPHRSPSLRRVT
jgi:hypothetical protein